MMMRVVIFISLFAILYCSALAESDENCNLEESDEKSNSDQSEVSSEISDDNSDESEENSEEESEKDSETSVESEETDQENNEEESSDSTTENSVVSKDEGKLKKAVIELESMRDKVSSLIVVLKSLKESGAAHRRRMPSGLTSRRVSRHRKISRLPSRNHIRKPKKHARQHDHFT